MLRGMLAGLTFFSVAAFADVYQINVGQHQSLGSGDVAVVFGNGTSSTISCTGGGGGNPGLPTRQRFQYTQFGAYERQTVQVYPEQALMSQCQRYASLQEPKQAIAFAVSTARELCFEKYQTCAPPGREDEQYYFNYRSGANGGRPGCEVTAFIIGTNPRF